MATLDAALFRGDRILDSDVGRCEASNRGSAIDDILRDAGREDNEPVACLVLTLSPDNERVAGGEFVTRGVEVKDFVWESHKLWPKADKRVVTTVTMPALDSFSFKDGGLTSDFLSDEDVVHYHSLVREGRPAEPVLEADREERGVGRFCLRLICNVSKGSSEDGVKIKFWVMLYPEDRNVLLVMSASTKRPEWPGVKLGEGEMRLLPLPAAPWGCPVIPILVPGQPFEELPRAPSSPVLRSAIGAIMRRCGQPERNRTGGKTMEMWDKLAKNPGTLTAKKPAVTWPADQLPTTNTAGVTGNEHFNSHSNLSETKKCRSPGLGPQKGGKTGKLLSFMDMSSAGTASRHKQSKDNGTKNQQPATARPLVQVKLLAGNSTGTVVNQKRLKQK